MENGIEMIQSEKHAKAFCETGLFFLHLLKKKIMTCITIKNSINNSQLNLLLKLFDSWNIEAEVTEDNKAEKQSVTRLFSKTRGMWKDYDIDGDKLR